jgi:hypothetical protein
VGTVLSGNQGELGLVPAARECEVYYGQCRGVLDDVRKQILVRRLSLAESELEERTGGGIV